MIATGPKGAVGLFELPVIGLTSTPNVWARRLELPGEAWHIEGLLDARSTEMLLSAAQRAPQVPVGLDGILSHYSKGNPIGSLRCSAYNEQIAAVLWTLVRQGLTFGVLLPRVFSEFDHVDWDNHPFWEPDGVNPLLRFIRMNVPVDRKSGTSRYHSKSRLVIRPDPFVEIAGLRGIEKWRAGSAAPVVSEG